MNIFSDSYEDFVIHDLQRYVQWHRRALENPPDQYKLCADLVKKLISTDQSSIKLLNACAGNGSLIYHLSKEFTNLTFVGVDSVKELIEDDSTEKIVSSNIKLAYLPTWILDIEKQKYDLSIHWMRLLHFADWQSHIKALMTATKPGGNILVSSLFNTHNVDLLATILDYSIPACRDGYCLQYNTFSCSQIKQFCHANGAKSVEFFPYEIPFDIPRKQSGVGSYTITTKNGNRETISGGLRMQWQVLHIQI